MNSNFWNNNRNKLIISLLLGIAIITTQYYNFGMMVLTTFLLAYISKGMRKIK